VVAGVGRTGRDQRIGRRSPGREDPVQVGDVLVTEVVDGGEGRAGSVVAAHDDPAFLGRERFGNAPPITISSTSASSPSINRRNRVSTETDTHTEAPTSPSLYQRIGGRATLERVVPDVIALHLENPIVGERFRAARKPIAELERLAIEFFATGLSGKPSYAGLSMPEAHAGMAITAEEYVAVLDDILTALDRQGVGQVEKAELLAIAYSMKDQIIGK